MAAPVVVVTGERSADHVVLAAQSLTELVPGARHETDGDVGRAVEVLGA